VCFKHNERISACLIRALLRPGMQLYEQCGHE